VLQMAPAAEGRHDVEIPSVDAAADVLEATAWPPALTRGVEAPDTPAVSAAAGTSAGVEGWVEVQLALRLLAPLSVPYRTVGNVGEALDFLPGHHLLPLLDRIL